MNNSKVEYEKMLPYQIVAARKKCPVAYLPIGTIEWHGVHNPIGLDALKAHALAVKCAEQGGGLVFPTLWYGENRAGNLMEVGHDHDGMIAASMDLPRENFKTGYMEEPYWEQTRRYMQLLLHICREIKSLGFKVVVIIAGHYPLLHYAKLAAEWLNAHEEHLRVVHVTGYELVQDEIPDAGDHAGKWETSLMLALLPHLVDMNQIPKEPAPLIGTSKTEREANLEYGQRGVELVVKRFIEKAMAALAEVR